VQLENNHKIVRFGVFEVDMRTSELRRRGSKVKLQDQPFQVLAMLLEKPGEVVTREELRDRLWPDGVFVDFDKSLSKAVYKVRDALGDSPANSRFIETLARRGYRFLAPVELVHPANPTAASPLTPPAKSTFIPLSRGRKRQVLWGITATLAMTIVVGASVWVSRNRRVREARQPGLIAVPLTTYPGRQLFPSFSPDGNQVAFTWDGPKLDNPDIYLKPNGTENLLRLTQNPASDYAPAWSPDGRYIAFLRDLPASHVAVMMIPSFGGPPERQLTEIRSVTDDPKIGEALPGLSWSPDGKWLVTKDRGPGEANESLYLLSTDSGEKRRLTFPPSHCGDGTPAFSPDGRSIAFSRTFTLGVSELFLLEVSKDLLPKSPPKQLTFTRQWTVGLTWTPDGREIVYSSGSPMAGGSVELRRVSLSGSGEPRLLAFAGEHGQWPAISGRGNRLAFARIYANDENIWRLDLSAGKATKPIKMIASTRCDRDPQYSPDGKRVVLISQRSGRDEVWVCNSDGSGAVQLTALGAAITGCPRWSPDGTRIVFDSNAVGTFDVYVIDADGGQPKHLTYDLADDGMASWSRDGRFIYFVSNRTKTWEIWKIPATGGEATLVTQNGGYVASESVDGATLYYAKRPTESSLWRRPVRGGEETQIVDSIYGIGFAVLDNGIYFERPPETGGSPTLRFLSLKTGAIKTIASIPRLINQGLSVSPDGRYALYTQQDQVPGSDLMVVENFR
jgi:Tol biopolymer transport system component/DNA-binding winged helix-turn-helix (wHTH) protein